MRLKFFKRQQESGRSMVEILGVLAVMGIISAAGYSGLGYATRRYRITQTIDQVNLAMQAARELALKSVSDTRLKCTACGDNQECYPCCIPYKYVMQGSSVHPCKSENLPDGSAFTTAIGACVAVCRNENQIWYLSIDFPKDNPKKDIITPEDCRNVIGSEISQNGFLNTSGGVQTERHDNNIDIQAVCDLFQVNEEDEEENEED